MRSKFKVLREVGKIKLTETDNSSSELRFSRVRIGKDLAVDVRKWVKTEKYDGPTKAGICLREDNWEEFLSLIKKAMKSKKEIEGEK